MPIFGTWRSTSQQRYSAACQLVNFFLQIALAKNVFGFTRRFSASDQVVPDKRLQSRDMPEELAPMPEDAEQLNPKIERAVAEGQLMESTAKNIHTLLAGARSDIYFRSVS